MTTLSRQARETIKTYSPDITIAGYIRHYMRGDVWHGDTCGCVDDRCIGHHHDGADGCHCLPSWLDQMVDDLKPRCGETSGDLICPRAEGHDGPHVVWVDGVMRKWADDGIVSSRQLSQARS